LAYDPIHGGPYGYFEEDQIAGQRHCIDICYHYSNRHIAFGGTALVAGGKVATNEVDINFNEFTEKTAINVYNELLLISATEQGVKYYDTKKRFIIKLNATHLELKYKGKTGTIADNEPKTYLYAIRA